MNPRINALQHQVLDLAEIRRQQADLARAEAEIIARLRESVTPDDVAAFRQQYGAMVVPALVQESKAVVLPVAEWIAYAEHHDSWPLLGAVVQGSPVIHVRDLIDIVGTQKARIDVPFTPILAIKSRQTREDALRLLIAAPTPTVAKAMQEAGDERFADAGRVRVDFRKPPTRGETSEGGDDAD